MGQTIDFDAFRAEQNQEPVQLRIGGVVHDLPPSLPAVVALDIVRLRESGVINLKPEDLEPLGVAVFGDEFHEIVRVNRLTVDELGELLKRVLQAYNATGTPPSRAARRKSKRSSSR